jgi:hypothetical protein
VLADVLVWRSRTAPGERDATKFRGVPTFRMGIPVPAADLHALAADELDPKALDQLLRACLALNWRGVRHAWTATKPDIPVTTLGLLHPMAGGVRPGSNGGPSDDADEPIPALAPDWASRLIAGQIHHVHDEAAARLLQVGWAAVTAPPAASAGDGARIAAALVPRCLHPRAVLSTIAINIKTPEEELS